MWSIIALVLIAIFNNFGPRKETQQKLSYSQFIHEIQEGNITSVVITNHNISGMTQGKKTFTTYLPLDDPSLLPLLVEKGIEVKMPIILIGTKMDLHHREVSEEDINNLIKKYDLDGVFYTSIYDTDSKEKRASIFKCLIEKIEPLCHVHDCSIFIPREDESFKEFAKQFSTCPICKRNNHFESLKNFYFSREPEIIELRERLSELIDESKDFDDIYYNKIDVGIPCCNCFSKYLK